MLLANLTEIIMPARKTTTALLSHRMAVESAPDSEHKRAVVETANARFLLLNGDLLQRNLQLIEELHQNTRWALPESQTGPELNRAMNFALRLATQTARLRAERDRVLEQAFEFARTRHYQETGVRVGELFSPLAPADELDTSSDRSAPPAQSPEPAPDATNPPAPEPETATAETADSADAAPASNKRIKACVRRLREAKVPADLLEQFRRAAQTERWSSRRLSQELHRILAA
jgi:hypothetical protein